MLRFLALLAFAYLLALGAAYSPAFAPVAALLAVLSIWCVVAGVLALGYSSRRVR